MSESPATKSPKDRPENYGLLTDEGIQKLRSKVGIQFNQPRAAHNLEVTWDGSRHFAYGYGDDNPLWSDPAYAAGTRWKGLIAPPNFIYTIGEADAPPPSPEQKAILKGDPLAGLGSYQAVMEFEWWRPLHLGNSVKKRAALVGVEERTNSAFSGRNVAEITAFFFRNQDDEMIALQRGTWIRAERHASAERKKKYELPVPYTKEQLARIDAAYDAEEIRGGNPRYWEDVDIGDELQTIVRGPMRTSDLIVWHIGWGMQMTPPGAFKIMHKVRRKAPGLFTPNPLGIPDTVQRLHWEREWANELGIPVSYDYGAIRETFLTNLVTNWMGDEGWLWKLSCQHRKFVYTGDTYWMKGHVKDKRTTSVGHEVDLDIRVENQWGTVVSPGTATVLLPTRQSAVTLPRPPKDQIDALIEFEIDRNKPKSAT